MNEEPSDAPPGACAPPPSCPAASPRQGKPWWIWLLAGCGGCALLGTVGIIVVVAMGANYVGNVLMGVGPVTTASVQESLGADVPLYPGSKLEPIMTRTMLTTFRFGEKMPGRTPMRGVAALTTQDSAKKVFQFYDKKLKAAGWKSAQGQGRGTTEQRMYWKGDEVALVQYKVRERGPMIKIMRGGLDLARWSRSVPH